MRETRFIEQNKQRWTEFEDCLKRNEQDPEKLSQLYIQIMDDLSYARTFYPNRSVRVYLNNLAQQIFYRIYKNKKGNLKRFIAFWKDDLPQIVYESRRELLLSLIVFISAVIIGVVSSVNDPEFSRFILGNSYVDMTLENIKKGDPMAVYKKANGFDMFLGITFNNVFIAFQSFIFGALFTVGSFVVLIYNGIMIGTFQHFFYIHGYFRESLLTVWLHGTLEISSIIIAGGAGLRMGKGLIFPGTYSRLQSFMITARQGAKLLAGIVPIVVFAAIIESFLTRYTNTPQALRFGVIFLSLAFVFLYFVRYPYVKAKKRFLSPLPGVKLRLVKAQKINYEAARTNGEVFKDIFIFYKKYFKKLLLLSVIIAAAYTVIIYFVQSGNFTFKYRDWFFLFQFFNYNKYSIPILLNTTLFSVVAFSVFYCLLKESPENRFEKDHPVKTFAKEVTWFFLVFLIINLTFILPSFLITLVFPLVIPFMMLWLFIMFREDKNIFNGFGRTMHLLRNSYWKLTGLFIMLIFVSFIYYFLFSSPLVYIYFEAISWSVYMSTETSKQVLILMMTFTSILGLSLVSVIWFSGIGLFYFSAREIKEAHYLKQKILNFGN
jgi:uncharacterized membrane protein SpoIIM required for sporulation